MSVKIEASLHNRPVRTADRIHERSPELQRLSKINAVLQLALGATAIIVNPKWALVGLAGCSATWVAAVALSRTKKLEFLHATENKSQTETERKKIRSILDSAAIAALMLVRPETGAMCGGFLLSHRIILDVCHRLKQQNQKPVPVSESI